MSFFLAGFVIGLFVAVPVGPIGVLCMHRTLSKGRVYGLVSGLGAATADAFYGFIAAFGLTFISNFLIKEQMWLRIIGGVFLCVLGVRTFLSKVKEIVVSSNDSSYARGYGSTLLLTLMSPATVIAFAAVFAGLGIVGPGLQYTFAVLLVAGVFLGSGFWWVILSSVAGIFRDKLSHMNLVWLNRISGTVIVLFGLVVLLSLMI